MNRPILVAVAWPYASGSLHLGHLAGAYLPADIFARYHRLAGNRVLMVSGSDGHGTPIIVAADKEGVSPREIVDRYHPEILGYWESLGISFDLFTTTLTDNHREVTWDIFRAHRRGGTIVEGESLQFYDPQAERFLPDRYVEGTCPHCGYTESGDQCDNCGRTLDPDRSAQSPEPAFGRHSRPASDQTLVPSPRRSATKFGPGSKPKWAGGVMSKTGPSA